MALQIWQDIEHEGAFITITDVMNPSHQVVM